jgi:predicted enzyme related to lactoylglutathione lyase
VDTADKHGGTVVAPPMDIPQAGRMAALLDPAGAAFSVITSGAM